MFIAALCITAKNWEQLKSLQGLGTEMRCEGGRLAIKRAT